MDPTAAAAILASLFTLEGATVASTIVAAIIQYGLKPIPKLGDWIEAGHEYVVALFIAGGLLIFSIVALGKPTDLVADFGYLLAWLGMAKLIGAAYDVAKATKAVAVSAASGTIAILVISIGRR